MATYSKPAAAGASLHPMLNIAVKAARAAGGIINRASLDLDSVRVARKAANDIVHDIGVMRWYHCFASKIKMIWRINSYTTYRSAVNFFNAQYPASFGF